MTGYRHVHILNFTRKFTVNSAFFLVPLYFLRLDFSGWQIGFIMAGYAAAPLLFSFPAGWLNDRIPAQHILRAGLLVLAVCLWMIGWFGIFWAMVPLFLLLGLANNALDVSSNSFMYKDESAVDLNRKYGTYSFWLALGMACGTGVGGWLVKVSDFRTMFSLFGLLLALVFLGFRVKPIGPSPRIRLREYRFDLWNRKTLTFSLMIFLLTLHWGAEGTVYAPFLKSRFGLDPFQVSLFIALPLFVLAFSAWGVGRVRFDENVNRRLLIAALGLSGTGHILMVQDNVYVSWMFRALHEAGDGVLGALIVLYVSRLFAKRSIGGSSGVLLMVMTSGHMLGALLFSHLGFRWGLQIPFLVSGAILWLDAAYAAVMIRWALPAGAYPREHDPAAVRS